MTHPTEAWEQRLTALWDAFGDLEEGAFLARMSQLADELPADSAVAAFEQAGAFDSTGHPDRAIKLYRRALTLGLPEERRRQAVIQLASSLRNVGEAGESVALLKAELSAGRTAGSDSLDDAVAAFLALALVDSGREREAVSVALLALSSHLTRYQRSLRNYAQDLAPSPT